MEKPGLAMFIEWKQRVEVSFPFEAPFAAAMYRDHVKYCGRLHSGGRRYGISTTACLSSFLHLIASAVQEPRKVAASCSD
jgi:hypothetical protein